MKPAPFTYHRPATVSEALGLLACHPDGKILAGGQSLLPIMNMRLAEPAHLIDISAVAELRRCHSWADRVSYGAATTHAMIEDGLAPDGTDGLLQRAASGIGYRAIRTRGTLGGSLAHADSSAEWPTVMSALDSTVVTESPRGARRIPVRELFTGFFSTTLTEDELITAVEVPRPASGTRWGLYKMARKPGEFAESLAVVLHRSEGWEIWLGAARPTPVRLREVEDLLTRQRLPEIGIGELATAIQAATGLDGHPRQLHAVALHRSLRAAEGVAAHA